MNDPAKIYPSVDECQVKNKVICHFEDCRETFTSESNLHLHLSKTHKAFELKNTTEKWYYCPIVQCPWNSTKHFKNMKHLRQHYLKVHKEKTHCCESCKKSFPTQVLLTQHIIYCNVTFNCLDCKAHYGCYNTLMTHCRRKKHTLLQKHCYRQDQVVTKNEKKVLPSGYKPILPKDDRKVIQCSCETKATQIRQSPIQQMAQQTQTGLQNLVKSVETQTELPIIEDIVDENYKSMDTQTDLVQSKESSCNTSFNFEEFESSFRQYIERNNSSTQTDKSPEVLLGLPTATHGSVPTNTSDLLADSLSNFDTNFFNCHTETQTDLMFDDNDIFNPDYYSNMYTQTCDEILEDLNGFTDIQTQTVLHENSTKQSVESQTLMSSIDKLSSNVLKAIVHSETQTDAEFRQMLEIINS